MGRHAENKYVIKGEVCEIYSSDYPLNKHKGEYLGIIDTADLEKVSKYVWHRKSDRYAYNCKIGFLHNYLLHPEEGYEVDHINRNGFDNRRCNLEIVTHQENCRRRGVRKDNTSGVTGVSYNKCVGLWSAYTVVNGKILTLGYYGVKEDAIYAREVYNKYQIKPERKKVIAREYAL